MPERRPRGSVDLLIEIGTEELPPLALTDLAAALRDGVRQRLEEQQLFVDGSAAAWYCSPRRLAVVLEGIPKMQPDREDVRRGPSLQAAYGQDGKPTKAAEGFARSCEVAVTDLETESTDKGVYLVVRRTLPGATTAELLPGIVEAALSELPIPKRMRWSDSDAEFVRPVHWVVLRQGKELIEAEVMGLATQATSRGHRFHHPGDVKIKAPADYPQAMFKAKVLLEDEAGHLSARIAELVREAAEEVGGEVPIDGGDALVREVAALVEWPNPVVGRFVEAFLTVPEEVLISVLAKHQRCFPVRDSDGRLMPYFVTVANIESKDEERVRHGNERVVHPRLSDAMFFYSKDQEIPLDARRADLAQVTFQKDLGTLAEKCDRMVRLAEQIAPLVDAKPHHATRAAELSKCDLSTDMVGEFPELQGVMGRYYALAAGEEPEVAAAIEDQYRPRFAGDTLPESDTGAVLALADKMDTIVGIFAVGQAPTGVRDPFGVRRAALGVLRIIVELQLDIDLGWLIRTALAEVPEGIARDDAVVETEVYAYMMERLRGYLIERGQRGDVFDAVMANKPTEPADVERRVIAVEAFLTQPAAANLTAANKRIANILKKAGDEGSGEVDKGLLKEDAEVVLNGMIERVEHTIVPNIEKGNYDVGLEGLADLRAPVDRFFDDILVMASDPKLRVNRIALLRRLRRVFLYIADLSLVQLDDEGG